MFACVYVFENNRSLVLVTFIDETVFRDLLTKAAMQFLGHAGDVNCVQVLLPKVHLCTIKLATHTDGFFISSPNFDPQH